MGSRAGEGWDGWRQWQLSTAETRTDWRSDRPVVLDVPSAAIFLFSASARCAEAHVQLRRRRRRRLFAVGKNFLFSSLAGQLGRRKGVFFVHYPLLIMKALVRICLREILKQSPLHKHLLGAHE